MSDYDGSKTLETRVTVLEVKIERVVSDIESEKGTRSRANSDINAKLDAMAERQIKTDRVLYKVLGGLTLAQVLVQYVLKGH